MILLERRRRIILLIFERLLNTFGPQNWWPAESQLEMIIGAILTQNTSWTNVEKAIEQLKRHRLIDLQSLFTVDENVLKGIIRSTGYYNQKAHRLKCFCEYIICRWQGDLEGFLAQEPAKLRAELLSIPGIGPETADSIILYAANKPSFVVDSYTHRIFSRHGLVPQNIDYEELRSFFMDCLPPDVALFQEYHALIVKTGKEFCRRRPLCEKCPLGSVIDV